MISEHVSKRLSALHPEGAAELLHVNRIAHSATDPDLLQLCSDCIRSMLQEVDWSPPRALSEREQAFLEFTEQFATSVSTLSDEHVSRLLQFATADEVHAFVSALYVVDMTQRVDLVAGRLLT